MPITIEYLKEVRAKRAALEDAALLDGKLWTIQIAYKSGGAFAVVYYGRIGPAEHEAFTSQHTDAAMFLEPSVVLGDKLHVRQQVCKMANTDEITIRVVGAPKREPITPGVWGV